MGGRDLKTVLTGALPGGYTVRMGKRERKGIKTCCSLKHFSLDFLLYACKNVLAPSIILFCKRDYRDPIEEAVF